MNQVLAFDLYGTLVDTNGLTRQIDALIKQASNVSASQISALWRQKQLEYTFRRSLMNDYVDFDVCTKQALIFTLRHFDINDQPDDIEQLLTHYQCLPSFQECEQALSGICQQFPSYVFSNGCKPTVAKVLESAKLDSYFRDIISVDEVKVFKPHPSTYQWFSQQTNTPIEQCYLISANSFDLMGAAKAGMKTIWLNRSYDLTSFRGQLDPWDIKTTHTIGSLAEIPQLFDHF